MWACRKMLGDPSKPAFRRRLLECAATYQNERRDTPFLPLKPLAPEPKHIVLGFHPSRQSKRKGPITQNREPCSGLPGCTTADHVVQAFFAEADVGLCQVRVLYESPNSVRNRVPFRSPNSDLMSDHPFMGLSFDEFCSA